MKKRNIMNKIFYSNHIMMKFFWPLNNYKLYMIMIAVRRIRRRIWIWFKKNNFHKKWCNNLSWILMKIDCIFHKKRYTNLSQQLFGIFWNKWLGRIWQHFSCLYLSTNLLVFFKNLLKICIWLIFWIQQCNKKQQH